MGFKVKDAGDDLSNLTAIKTAFFSFSTDHHLVLRLVPKYASHQQILFIPYNLFKHDVQQDFLIM